MDKTHQQDLNRIMLKHVRESTYIAENFAKVTAEIKERVRQDVIQKLKEKLDEKYVVQSGDKADKWFSQIWIKLMGFEKAKLHFGIESFSGNGNFKGNLFIGVFNQSGKKNRYLEKSDRHSNHWVNVKELTNYGSFKMNLRSPDTLEALSEDKLFQEGFADHIVNEVEVYLEQHVEQLQAFLKSETLVSAN